MGNFVKKLLKERGKTKEWSVIQEKFWKNSFVKKEACEVSIICLTKRKRWGKWKKKWNEKKKGKNGKKKKVRRKREFIKNFSKSWKVLIGFVWIKYVMVKCSGLMGSEWKRFKSYRWHLTSFSFRFHLLFFSFFCFSFPFVGNDLCLVHYKLENPSYWGMALARTISGVLASSVL